MDCAETRLRTAIAASVRMQTEVSCIRLSVPLKTIRWNFVYTDTLPVRKFELRIVEEGPCCMGIRWWKKVNGKPVRRMPLFGDAGFNYQPA